ncbi:unnamed protein product [Scytosiphon promiscuus]
MSKTASGVGVETYLEEVMVGAATLLQAVPVVGEVCTSFLSFTALVSTARTNKDNLRTLQSLCDTIIEEVLIKQADRLGLLTKGFVSLREEVKKAEEVAKLCNGARLKEKIKRIVLAGKICGDIASITERIANFATVNNFALTIKLCANFESLGAASADFKSAQDKLEAAGNQVALQTKELAEREKNLDARGQASPDLKEALRRSKEALAASERDLEAMIDKVTAKDKELKVTQEDLETMKQDVALKIKKLEDRDKKDTALAPLKAELRRSKDALAALESELEARIDKNRELQATQKDLETMREQVASKTKEIQDKEEDYCALKVELRSSKSALASIEASLEEKRRVIELASRVKVPSEAPRIRNWYVEREAVVSEACDRLVTGNCPNDSGEPRMVGLAGPSGAGKSTVASMVVAREDLRASFHKGVIWLSVGQGAKERVNVLMRQLANKVYEKVMQKTCDPLPTGKEGAAYIRDVVGADRRRFLVVADDVWEAEVLQELDKAGVWVLYTTRSDLRVGEAPLRLDQVLQGEAELIFRRAAEIDDEARLPEQAYDLMERCEFSALDLAFLGRWRAVRRKTSAKAWQSVLDRIVNMQSSGRDDGDELPWRVAVLYAGLDELAQENISNKELYLSLAVLPKGLAFAVKDAAALLDGKDPSGEDCSAAREVVVVLERWSILTLQEGGMYRVHDSHADFIEGHIARYPVTRDNALENWMGYMSTIDALFAWPCDPLADIWRACARVQGKEGAGVSVNQYDDVVRAIESSGAHFLDALRRVALFQYAAKFPREAGQTWTKLLGIKKQQLAQDHPDVAEALYYIGLCHLSAGDHEQSEEVYLQALAMQERIGAPRQTLAYTQYCLGDCAQREKRVHDAEKWYQLAYENRRGIVADTVLACNAIQIGWCYMRTDRLGEAEKLFREALEVQESNCSPSHPHIQITLQRLGSCLRQMSRPTDAEDAYKRYFKICEKYRGADEQAGALLSMGTCALEAERKEDAAEHFRRAIGIWNASPDSGSQKRDEAMRMLDRCKAT